MTARANHPSEDVVLLLHGLGRTPASMGLLARALRREGFAVENWGYNSLCGGIADQVSRLHPQLARLRGYRWVHAVGHSLGGLLLRGLLTGADDLPLGRIVFIGTPHKGASMLNRNPLLFGHRFVPRILRDLRAESPAIRALGFPAMETGVIVGVQTFSPFNPVSWINRHVLGSALHDGTVEVASASLQDATDSLEVAVNHSLLPLSGRVIRPTITFLQNGRFSI